MSQPFPNDDRRLQVRWLNIRQLMEIVPLKKSRIYYLVHRKEIPFYKIGQSLFFRLDEVVAWLDRKRSK